MTLVQPQNQLNQAQIESAELSIAAQLGMPSLAERSVTEFGSLLPSGSIILHSVISEIDQVNLNGQAVTDYDQTSPRQIQITTESVYGRPWGHGYADVRYEVVFTSGWTEQNLPEALKQAILRQAQAEALASQRAGIQSESMGPVSRTYMKTGFIGDDVTALISQWLPTRF